MKYMFIGFAILATIFSYLWFTDRNLDYDAQLIRDQWMVLVGAAMAVDALGMICIFLWEIL